MRGLWRRRHDETGTTLLMVLGSERCGSNLVESALNDHPQIVCLGEVFNHGLERSKKRLEKLAAMEPEPLLRGKLLSDPDLPRKDPIGFVRTLTRKDCGPIQVVGFRAFYHHLDRRAWRQVRRQPNLRVIHLIRENLLAQLYSLRRAEETGIWIATSTPTQLVPISIPFEDCRAFFEERKRQVDHFRKFFAKSIYHELTFEDLSDPAHQPRHLEALQEFLSVRAQPLTSPFRRITTTPLSDSVTNYLELQSRFEGSAWEPLFR